jgi:uroporphyrinogen decarboxylase
MTRRELVKAAIAHQTTPRIPYCIDLCPEAWDVLKKYTDLPNPTEFADNDVLDWSAPWWGWHHLGPDWAQPDPPTSRPKTIGTGSYPDFVEAIKKSRQTSDKYFLVRQYAIHFEKAYFARGFENFLADIGSEPAFAKKLLDFIIERNLVMLENILSLDEIDGVLMGSDWGSQLDTLMSVDLWDELIRPGEQKMYDLVKSYGKDVWIHSCGNISRLIPRLVEMGVQVLNPVQPEAMDIVELKRLYGHKLTFWGGISTQKTLPYGTPDEVRAEARQVRNLLSRNGGYIFSPAQSIQDDVPVPNILALLEVARENL